MVRVLVENIPLEAAQKEQRKIRNINRKTDGKFDLVNRLEKQKSAELRCRLNCNNYHLVALWFATLDMDWKKTAKKRDNPSLADAIYEDFNKRGIEVDETSWVAYQVTKQTTVHLLSTQKSPKKIIRFRTWSRIMSVHFLCAVEKGERI